MVTRLQVIFMVTSELWSNTLLGRLTGSGLETENESVNVTMNQTIEKCKPVKTTWFFY